MPQKKPYWPRLFFIPLFCLLFIGSTNAQDSLKFRQRKKFIIVANSLAYSSLMVGLNELWYKDYPRSKFHFFNDNKQWLQMDKVGHLYSCYYEGLVGIEMMKWAGYTQKEYSLIGGAYGLFIQTGVEILDGFSEEWGASPGDMTANIIGAGLAISQSYFWDEQRCIIKYSYSPSSFPQYRPNVLGNNNIEQLFKDYNGQTYWMSCNIRSFMPETKWPSWLNVAIGYGADGMVGGDDNIFHRDGIVYDYSSFHRKRQFYISPDIDLSKIQTKNKVIRSLLIVFNSFKFPMPTIEYHSDIGLKGHWIKF
jgi:hypothetical protein